MVAEDLDAVDVSHNTVTIVHLEFVGSHVRQRCERLTEVLGTRNLGRKRTEGSILPSTVVKTKRGPLRRNRGRIRGQFPLLLLHNGVVKGKGVDLLVGLRHKVAEDDVPVDTSDLHPRTRLPGIPPGVQKMDRVLTIGALGQAEFHISKFALGERRTCHEELASRIHLEGLFIVVAVHGLLCESHEHLVRFAGQHACCQCIYSSIFTRSYTEENGKNDCFLLHHTTFFAFPSPY